MTDPLIKVNEGWSRKDERKAYADFWKEMFPVVTTVVESTFAHESTGMRTPTAAEVKERVNVAKELVDTMRRQFGWSKSRIRDNLALALRTKLSGLVVDLDALAKRDSW